MEVSHFYRGQDPRELPFYTQTDTADASGVPRSTLRSWLKPPHGLFFQGQGIDRPLIQGPEGVEGRLSFFNLIEAFAVGSLRNVEGMTMRAVRVAHWTAQKRLSIDRPFLSDDIWVSGDLYWLKDEESVNLSRAGQYALTKVIESYLNRIVFQSGVPLQWFPMIPYRHASQSVLIDPRVQFGQPVIADGGISTQIIAELFDAGSSIEKIAGDYGVGEEDVGDALLFERVTL